MANGQDPLASFSFWVEAGGGTLSGMFRECSGLGSESEIIEYKASGQKGRMIVNKVPGRLKWNNISLKRGVTSEMDLWDWRKLVEEGRVEDARRDGSVVMYDQDGGEIARWNFTSGWPVKLSGPTFNAQNNEMGIEEMEICHEGLVRVK